MCTSRCSSVFESSAGLASITIGSADAAKGGNIAGRVTNRFTVAWKSKELKGEH